MLPRGTPALSLPPAFDRDTPGSLPFPVPPKPAKLDFRGHPSLTRLLRSGPFPPRSAVPCPHPIVCRSARAAGASALSHIANRESIPIPNYFKRPSTRTSAPPCGGRRREIGLGRRPTMRPATARNRLAASAPRCGRCKSAWRPIDAMQPAPPSNLPP